MNMSKKIIVVGAGAGGGLAASKIRKLLPGDDVEVTVIDKYGRTNFSLLTHWWPLGTGSHHRSV